MSDFIPQPVISRPSKFEQIGGYLYDKAEEFTNEEYEIIKNIENLPGELIKDFQGIELTLLDKLNLIFKKTKDELLITFEDVVNIFRPIFEKYWFLIDKDLQKYKLMSHTIKHKMTSQIVIKPEIDLNKRTFLENLIKIISNNYYFKYIYEFLSISEIYTFLVEFSGVIFTATFINSILEIFGISIYAIISTVSLTLGTVISILSGYLLIFATVMFFISILVSTALYVKNFDAVANILNNIVEKSIDITDDMKNKLNLILDKVNFKLNNMSFI
jgi:hypothetical protein